MVRNFSNPQHLGHAHLHQSGIVSEHRTSISRRWTDTAFTRASVTGAGLIDAIDLSHPMAGGQRGKVGPVDLCSFRLLFNVECGLITEPDRLVLVYCGCP